KSIVAIKKVSMNEPIFEGHFPHHPVMPGVLIIEPMAQAAALFSFEGDAYVNAVDRQIVYYLVAVDVSRFRIAVVPGDQLRLEVSADRLSRTMCKYTACATVDGQEVASAKLMCAIRALED